MSNDKNQEIEHLLKFKKPSKLIDFLNAASKAQVATYVKVVPKEIKKSSRLYWDWKLASSIREREKSKLDILSIVLYATSSLTEIKKAGWNSIPEADTLKQLFETFRPSWIDNWACWVIEDNPHQFGLIYSLVKEGYCTKPRSESYVLGMIAKLKYSISNDKSLAECIKSEFEYLQEDIWRIFEVEGGGELSLAACDKYSHPSNTWEKALKSLSDEGAISREKLLDCSLEALMKDFAQFRAGWYSRFFVSLNPTIEELDRRKSKLLFLLGSQVPPTVSFALKHLQKLEKKKHLDVDAFIENIEPTLNAKAKTTVMMALKILESMAKRTPQKQSQIAQASVGAILFDNAEVQEKVFDLLDKFADSNCEQIRNTLLLQADFILPSLKQRLEQWGVAKEEQSEEFTATDLASSEFDSNRRDEAVIAIESIEELIEELSYLIEEPSDPIRIERVLDGVNRLCKVLPTNFDKISSPLMKRATTLVSRGSEKWMIFQISRLALSVIERTNHFYEDFRDLKEANAIDFETLFLYRLYYLVERCLKSDNNDITLISAPTDVRGFIDPLVLVERIQAYEGSNESYNLIDSVIAILRLNVNAIEVEQTSQLIQDLTKLNTELALACAYALGGEVEIGNESALWIAACRIRNPGKDDQNIINKFGELGPDAGRAAVYRPWVKVKHGQDYTFHSLRVERKPDSPKIIPIERVAVLFHENKEGFYSEVFFGYNEALVRWGATIWPSNLEPYFACGACELSIVYPEAQWHVQSFFLPMLDSRVPLNLMALLLVIAGLSSTEPGQKGIAIDIVIMGIDDGRLDVKQLGDLMSQLIASGLIVVSRWTKALKEIAAISKRHADAVRLLIQSLFGFEPSESPRDLGGLIELLYELQVAANAKIDDERAIAFFKANKKGGKQGKFARKLLQMAE